MIMKIRSVYTILICLALLFPFSVVASPAAKAYTKQTKKNVKDTSVPDFAFPQIVIDNSEVDLAKATKSGNEAEIINSCIRLVIANDLISSDRMPRMANMLDSIAQTLSPTGSAILYSLEAQLYSDVYNDNPYAFSRRNLPLDTYPDNPLDWSKDLFAKKILELVKKSLANKEALVASPITAWRSILVGAESPAIDNYPTLYSLLAKRNISYLYTFRSNTDVIPFGNKEIPESVENLCVNECQEILSYWKNNAIESGRVGEIVTILNIEIGHSDSFTYKDFINYYNQYQDSPFSVEFLITAYEFLDISDFKQTQEYISLAESCYEKHKDYYRINRLLNILTDCKSGALNLQFNNRISPEQDAIVTVYSNRMPANSYLCLYGGLKQYDGYYDIREALKNHKCKLIASKQFKSTTESCDTTIINFGKLAPGEYIMAACSSENGTVDNLYDGAANLSVTKYAISTISTPKSSTNFVQVVSSFDGKPIEGCKVDFVSKYYENSKKELSGITDKDGIVSVPDKFSEGQTIDACVRDKNDMVYTYVTMMNREYKSEKRAEIFTDLSLYHPGDTCQFALVVYNVNHKDRTQQILSDVPVNIQIEDCEYETITTLSLVTDNSGRATGSFVIPKNGILGKYELYLCDENDDYIGYGRIEVAEYKQPQFYVELDKISNCTVGEELKISGSVRSFTNMPIANASVDIKIKRENNWWSNYSEGEFNEKVATDSEGHFLLTLSTTRLKNTKFENASYLVFATATSQDGETQKSETINFYIGSKLFINYNNEDNSSHNDYILKNADSGKISFSYQITGGKGDKEPLCYEFLNSENTVVLKGVSSGSTIYVETSGLNSGTYTLKISAADSQCINEVVIFRNNDKTPPLNTPLWVPQNKMIVPHDNINYNVKVGSSGTNYIFYMVCNNDNIIDKGFIRPSGKIIDLNVKAPQNRNDVTQVIFATADACVQFKRTIELIPEIVTENIKLETISFRDKINAGGKESWRFKYTLNNNAVSDGSVIATLSNKALNSICYFRWGKPIIYYSKPWTDYQFIKYGSRGSNGYINYNPYNFLRVTPILFPYINSYDYNLYSQSDAYGLMLRGTGTVSEFYELIGEGSRSGNYGYNSSPRRNSVDAQYKMAAPKAMSTAEKAMMDTEEDEMVYEDGVDNADVIGYDPKLDVAEPKYRPAEMALAWFKPNLKTDKDGVLEISFDVPDFNTTWQLQMLAYNKEMLSNLTVEDIVASKPVMVSVNSPRFLRTSDHVNLMATIFNNSDKRADVSGRMEIFNPIDNSVLLSKEFKAEPVDSAGSRLIAMDFIVPDNVEFVGYRVLGKIPGFSDGEQSLIAILLASSPVTESYPFYIAPEQTSYSVKLPNFDKDAAVSLQFCDNPVWECVTALPDMSFEVNASILSTANTLYGNLIAHGLVTQYPEIGKAISDWRESSDSSLVSPLQKNEELKIIALQNTPWTLNAQTETLRMSRLANLLDSTQSVKAIVQAIDKLKKEQSGGGWSWCPGMKPSVYITGQILWRLGMLSQMGYAEAFPELDAIATDALRFCDAELYKQYIKNKKIFSTTEMLGYLYIHSFFPKYVISSDFKALKAVAIKAIKNDWKQFSIYNKATAATLLFREKEPMLARTILESLNQYASNSTERGMWFDNLRSGMFTENTLITTAQALEAYTEITPEAPAVDLLRQWLIIERQAQDWGSDAQLAEVVHAILTSGTNWIQAAQPAEIYLDGKRLDTPEVAAYTGSTVITLDPNTASGADLRIEKAGEHPSWGGVIARYISPIEDVKVFSECDATITKTILIVDESESGTSVRELKDGDNVKLGQHLRVQLKVTASRDMDYVVIKDERGGCLAPKDQLSGYRWQDGIGYYREMRNDVTNFFLSRLPRGNFYVEYECYADREGEYSVGIASLQSLYAPTQSAHSAGLTLTVK